jgi:hypothetical protein
MQLAVALVKAQLLQQLSHFSLTDREGPLEYSVPRHDALAPYRLVAAL